MQELFTQFAAKQDPKIVFIHFSSNDWVLLSHTVVADIEIEFILRNFTEKPGSLKDHIQGIASGEVPYFPTTLSMVYGKLSERVVARSAASGLGLGKSTETGNQSVSEPVPTDLASASTRSVTSSSHPVRSTTATRGTWLICFKCHQRAMLQDLFDGTRCPRCPRKSSTRPGRPHMKCPLCNHVRTSLGGYCLGKACRAKFV